MRHARSSKKRKRDRLGNRLALVGISFVVLSLAMAVTIKSASLKDKDLNYQIREDSLNEQLAEEKERADELEQHRIYVQTKQYFEKVAKEKLGLVNPNEILLKSSEKE